MDPRPLTEQIRDRFDPDTHLRQVLAGAWEPMQDDHGHPLDGIRGRSGATGLTIEGHEIGVDLIEMQPGSSFPLHVHPGDHILIAHAGAGNVLIDGRRRLMHPGVTVFIAAEYEHGVGTYPDWPSIRDLTREQAGGTEATTLLHAREAWLQTRGVFTLYAVGVPHKHVSSDERMQLVDQPHHHPEV